MANDEVQVQEPEKRVKVTLRKDVAAGRVALPMGGGLVILEPGQVKEVPEGIYKRFSRYLKKAE